MHLTEVCSGTLLSHGIISGFVQDVCNNLFIFLKAKERANGMELDGRRIRVDFSITKRPHTPTPGIYMGRPT